MSDNDDKNLPDFEEEIDTDTGDEVTFEDMPENLATEVKDRTDKLKVRIKELEKKNAELLDSWQRDKAEFVNSRKRDEEQKREFFSASRARSSSIPPTFRAWSIRTQPTTCCSGRFVVRRSGAKTRSARSCSSTA